MIRARHKYRSKIMTATIWITRVAAVLYLAIIALIFYARMS